MILTSEGTPTGDAAVLRACSTPASSPCAQWPTRCSTGIGEFPQSYRAFAKSYFFLESIVICAGAFWFFYVRDVATQVPTAYSSILLFLRRNQ